VPTNFNGNSDANSYQDQLPLQYYICIETINPEMRSTMVDLYLLEAELKE
jgi:hypothetical protein